MVGILGIAVIGYAIYNFYKQVIKRKFAERIEDTAWVVRLGLIGYTAQSLVYAVIGYFFVQAAIAFKSKTAKGPSGALIELAEQGWGKFPPVGDRDRTLRIRPVLSGRSEVPKGRLTRPRCHIGVGEGT